MVLPKKLLKDYAMRSSLEMNDVSPEADGYQEERHWKGFQIKAQPYRCEPWKDRSLCAHFLCDTGHCKA